MMPPVSLPLMPNTLQTSACAGKVQSESTSAAAGSILKCIERLHRRNAGHCRRGGAGVKPAPQFAGRAWSIHPLELVHAAAEADLGGVDVALRVDRDVVHPLELLRLEYVAAELPDQFA